MITELSGVVKFSSPDSSFVVIETHGVGYEVYVSSSTRAALPFPGGPDIVTLKIKTYASENMLTLYGFATLAEYNAFRLLTSVPRVGPCLALKLLSLDLKTLFEAIQAGMPEIMLEIKGVGETSVKRIIHELREKKAGVLLLTLPVTQQSLQPSVTLDVHKKKYPETQARLEDLFKSRAAGSPPSVVPGGGPAPLPAPAPCPSELIELQELNSCGGDNDLD